MAAERRFRAMGSEAHVILVGGPIGLLDTAVHRIADLEAKWSRFLPDSEVCEINRGAGTAVSVSDDTVVLVRRAIEAWSLSGGAFDPTLLGAITRAGYGRSFELLETADTDAGPPPLGIGAAGIAVDGSTVRLPRRTGFDPGGIGKGLAADVVCAELLDAGAAGACINLGGDLRVAGTGPDGLGWTVGVEHPWLTAPFVLLGVADGAVATSTTLRRRWRVGEEERHHVIDPQTGRSSTTDLTTATVVAAEAWMAEVYAKAVLLAGSAHPFDILGGTGAEGIAVDGAGAVSATAGLAGYLGGAAAPREVRWTAGRRAERIPCKSA